MIWWVLPDGMACSVGGRCQGERVGTHRHLCFCVPFFVLAELFIVFAVCPASFSVASRYGEKILIEGDKFPCC